MSYKAKAKARFPLAVKCGFKSSLKTLQRMLKEEQQLFQYIVSNGFFCDSQKDDDDEVFDQCDGPCTLTRESDIKTVQPSKAQTFADNLGFLPSSNMQSNCMNKRLQMKTTDSQNYTSHTDILKIEPNQDVDDLEGFKNTNLNTNNTARQLTDPANHYDVLEYFGSNHDQRLGTSDRNSTSLSKNRKSVDNKESIGTQSDNGMKQTNSEQGCDVLECFGGKQDYVQGRSNTNNTSLGINKTNSEIIQSDSGKHKDDMNEGNAKNGCDVLESYGSNLSGKTHIQTIPENTIPSLKEKSISESIEIQNELESMFETICTIREESGLQSMNELDSIARAPMMSKCKQRQVDELDGSGIFGWVTDLTNWTVKQCTKSRGHRAGFVNNFLRKISFDGRESISEANPFFANYLKKDMEKLCFIDAGLAFNSPYPLLFQPGRDIDLILSFDFTDRKKDKNMPFDELVKAEEWAKTHNIKFPQVKDNISKYEEGNVREVYIFEDEKDMECPIIMHFVLVNKDFRQYTAPKVKRRTEDDVKFADFTIYDDQEFNSTTFSYNNDNFDRLSKLAEFIVLNNLQTIKKCIKKSIINKIGRTRKRHPTT